MRSLEQKPNKHKIMGWKTGQDLEGEVEKGKLIIEKD